MDDDAVQQLPCTNTLHYQYKKERSEGGEYLPREIKMPIPAAWRSPGHYRRSYVHSLSLWVALRQVRRRRRCVAGCLSARPPPPVVCIHIYTNRRWQKENRSVVATRRPTSSTVQVVSVQVGGGDVNQIVAFIAITFILGVLERFDNLLNVGHKKRFQFPGSDQEDQLN